MLAERGTLEASHTATLRQAEAANRELTRRIEESEQRDERHGEVGDKDPLTGYCMFVTCSMKCRL